MEENNAFVKNSDLYNKKIQSKPRPDPSVDFDTSDILFNSLKNVEDISQINISEIEQFNREANDRDQIYHLIDNMSEDSTIAAAMEIYCEDSCEYNENGRIVWVEADNLEISKYITYLLDTMNVDKNIYKWATCLIKYGDVYLRLYRESEYEDAIFNNPKDKEPLNENVVIKAFPKDDKIVHYLEMVPNPAEIFELTKFGKTSGYIKAPTRTSTRVEDVSNNIYYKYNFKKEDVEVHSPKDFVHACLEENLSRTPEEVTIFNNQNDLDRDVNGYTYTVKKGQSLFFNLYKIWRELMLLEVSLLLNRVTQSSIVRVIEVEVGEMDKNSVRPELIKIKNMIEQKASINDGMSYQEYTNPGPTENNIYVPVRDGKGALNVKQIGGDVDVGNLNDIDYFKDKFFAGLRIPKQYLGQTEDSTGFNGGTSLSIMSSRYAKAIKRIQNTLIQMITDAINIILLDNGLYTYVNNFSIHMLPPTTQEELDRKERDNSKIGTANDIMNGLSDIDDTAMKLKIYKALLTNVISNQEVLDLIQETIDNLESESELDMSSDETDMTSFEDEEDLSNFENSDVDNSDNDFSAGEQENISTPIEGENESSNNDSEESETLPNPSEAGGGIDFSDNTQF